MGLMHGLHGLRWRTVSALGLGVLVFPSCSASSTGPGVVFLLSSARWDARGPDAYTFLYEQVCECLPTGEVLLTVEDGDVIGAVSFLGSEPQFAPDPANFLTIDELFERLRQDAARDPVMFEVTFDEELGYPRTAVVDVSAGVADDEYRFEIREVSPLERLE